MTSVKICGLQPSDDVSFTKCDVVTHVGVIFVPQSRRYVDPREARKITTAVAPNCQVMGVFVNDPLPKVAQVLRESGTNGAQLHGAETPEECEALRQDGFITWKALSVPSCDDVSHLSSEMMNQALKYAQSIDALLLDAKPKDSAKRNVTGGHGQPFEWSLLPTFLQHWREETNVPVFVAGGLRPDNIESLLALCNPDGIDVSSGVEELGRKSTPLIHDLIEKVETHGGN